MVIVVVVVPAARDSDMALPAQVLHPSTDGEVERPDCSNASI